VDDKLVQGQAFEILQTASIQDSNMFILKVARKKVFCSLSMVRSPPIPQAKQSIEGDKKAP
jgi:hypothetical protein